MAYSSPAKPRSNRMSGIILLVVAATVLILILALSTAGDPPSEARVSSGQVLWGPPRAARNAMAPRQGRAIATLPVVFLRPAPAILPNQQPTHGFRGPCPQCHSYVKLNIQPSPWADWSTKPGPTPWLNSTGVAGKLNSLPESASAGGGVMPIMGGQRQPGMAQPGMANTQQQGLGPRPTVLDQKGRALPMMPYQEAHWQGIEVVPLTSGLAKVLKIPPNSRGVVLDDATMPADVSGFQAGDLITGIGGVATPDLDRFIDATNKVRELRQIDVQVTRKGQAMTLNLRSVRRRLGIANGETAPMIRAGAIAPHGYRGACTNCHHIGNNGQLAVDPGDLLNRTAPPIRASQRWAPHRDRGQNCATCHTIVP